MTPVLKTFLLAAILAWSGIVAAVWSMRSEPVLVQARAEARTGFDTRWDDATVLKKQDRLPLPAMPVSIQEPNSVERTILHGGAPARVPPVLTSLLEDKPATKRGRHVARDICTRHGKRKVAIHGGRSWRCK